MVASSWPGIRQLRALFGSRSTETTQQYQLNIDLAAMGTLERVQQCRQIRDFWQQMRDDAWESYHDGS